MRSFLSLDTIVVSEPLARKFPCDSFLVSELAAIQASAKYKDGEILSSSRIRNALENGAVERANTFLGRPYRICGKVVVGKQLGRTIGFPTANLETGPYKLIPRYGSYAAIVRLENGEAYKAVVGIGLQPSIGNLPLAVEAHLLDFSGDLYGQAISVDLLTFIRPEQKFASIEDLKRRSEWMRTLRGTIEAPLDSESR